MAPVPKARATPLYTFCASDLRGVCANPTFPSDRQFSPCDYPHHHHHHHHHHPAAASSTQHKDGWHRCLLPSTSRPTPTYSTSSLNRKESCYLLSNNMV
ncbi:hypothetical protein E2C01_002018 [Portunus trituberculatus]|uniref:Uncharacterized protein n=1 Tax=Portunus trituberculatus TaxID=210409 RepID=A0A5B7CIN1_PORTR|nr:hypothetical protein [Portunus trituberculatus]